MVVVDNVVFAGLGVVHANPLCVMGWGYPVVREAGIDLFWLYRAPAPGSRAQTIQVLHSAAAMAERGHRVRVCVHDARSNPPSATQLLREYGLSHPVGLRLHVLSGRGSQVSAAYWTHVMRWFARSSSDRVVVARSKRQAARLLQFRGVLPSFRLVLEVHEVDSLLAAEQGSDPTAWRALERAVLAGSELVTANCEGTLQCLAAAHAIPRSLVLHNATHRSRVRAPSGPGEDAGYLGSLRRYKGLEVLADAAALCSPTVTLVTPEFDSAYAHELVSRSGGALKLEPGVPPGEVADRMARFAVLVVPTGTSTFGEQLTSPLKLFDAVASGRPVIATDTLALRRAATAAGGGVQFVPPSDAQALANAIDHPHCEPNGSPRLWSHRAAELEAAL